MLVEISNISVSLDALLPDNADILVREVARKIGVRQKDLRVIDSVCSEGVHAVPSANHVFRSTSGLSGIPYGDYIRVLRRSVDARKKSSVHFVLTILADIASIKNDKDLTCFQKRLKNGMSARLYQWCDSFVSDLGQSISNADAQSALESYSRSTSKPALEAFSDSGSQSSSALSFEPSSNPNPELLARSESELPSDLHPAFRIKRPVIVGAGPAGLFAGLHLARAGLHPLIVERGKPVEDRMKDVDDFASGGVLDVNSNVQFGEGGAGTFSDGKLNTGIKSPHIRHVLEEFVLAGAPEDILIDAKPHIGTDLLPDVVRNIRKTIESAGGTFLFSTQLVGIEVGEAKRQESDDTESPRLGVQRVELLNLETGDIESIDTDVVVLAIGHSARDTFKMLRDISLAMERKPFAVGVRIEHLQNDINRAQYGDFADHPALGAADYKLAVHNDDGRGVYTFCMCPGGTVVCASSEPQGLCVNGMSVWARDGVNANSALLVEVKPDDLDGDDVLAGIALQQEIEHAAYLAADDEVGYKAPAQTVGDFMASSHEFAHIQKIKSDKHEAAESEIRGTASTSKDRSMKVRPTYPRGVVWVDLHKVLPPFVTDAINEALPKLDRKLNGFADPRAVMTAVEARSSSPVRIIRDRDTMQSVTVAGLYPAGEGAGYAGGIMSAAVDGIRVAEKIASIS